MPFIKYALLLLLCPFLFSQSAMACTCPERTTAESAAQADLIFVGRVKDISYLSMHSAMTGFMIKDIKKGVPHGTTELAVHSDIAAFSCGVAFQPDEDYLVFATRKGKLLSVSSCLPTTKLSDAETVLEELKVAFNPPK